MATKLKAYSTTPGSNNSAPPDGWPEGMLPSAVNNSAREMMARLAEWYTDAEWILRNDTVTGFTGATLTITGDVTSKYTVDRAIRLDESNSKLGIITASAFAAGSTTVTITGYTILALPTSVELGVIDSTKNALVTIRGAQTILGDKTFSGTLAMSAKPINEADRVDVASAATVDLDAAASNYVNITGTTTVTAITLSNGNRRHVVFAGALTLTNGASLILPGGANITTAAGDTATFIGEAAGLVRCVDYVKAANSPDGPAGAQVGFAYTADSTSVSTTNTIPDDNTIPQNTEGAEYTQIATTYTPKYANSLLEVEVLIAMVSSSASDTYFALFRDTTADAVFAFRKDLADANIADFAYFKVVLPATAATATTFKVRYGANAAATTYIGSQGGSSLMSTAKKSTMIVREIKQ